MAGKQRNSYFADLRSRYNDPNYVNRPEMAEDIQRNVRRIIKDVSNGNIIPEDFIYFTSQKLIQICIDECSFQMKHSGTIMNALNYYINTVLIHRMQPIWADPMMEHSNANSAIIEFTAKYGIWMTAYKDFSNIFAGGNPMQELSDLVQLKKDINMYL